MRVLKKNDTKRLARKFVSIPKFLYELMGSYFFLKNESYKPLVVSELRLESSEIKSPTEMLQSKNNQSIILGVDETMPLQLDSACNKAQKLPRIEKPIRVRILRFCHRCNTIYGRSRKCVVCKHILCEQCQHHPLERRTIKTYKSSLRNE